MSEVTAAIKVTLMDDGTAEVERAGGNKIVLLGLLEFAKIIVVNSQPAEKSPIIHAAVSTLPFKAS